MVPFDIAADFALPVLQFVGIETQESFRLVASEGVREEIRTVFASKNRVYILAVRTGEVVAFVRFEVQGFVTAQTLILAWSDAGFTVLITRETEFNRCIKVVMINTIKAFDV